MNVRSYKKYAYVMGLFLLVSIVGLWSWNTLAELFNGPHAQYKHTLAALGLMLTIKWALAPRGAMTRGGGNCLQQKENHAK
jgi:hypothetical protein